MATLQDIADRAGVSTETVSRVLRGKYRQTGERGIRRVKQVRQIADELGYRPDAAARSMKNRRSHLVGVVMPVDARSRLAHAVTMEIVFGINAALAEEGYVMSLLPVSADEVLGGKPQSRGLRERMVDGYILIDQVGEHLEAHIDAEHKPMVWVNLLAPEPAVSVVRDEARAGELAVEALAAAGHRRVLSVKRVAGQETHFSFAARQAGVDRAAARLKVEVEAVRVPLNVRESPDVGRLSEAFVSRARAVRALVVADAYLARRVIGDLAREHFVVGDYAVACCDDADELEQLMPWLSRAGFNRFEMGRLAGTALLRQVRGGTAETVVMQPQWLTGDSVCPARAG